MLEEFMTVSGDQLSNISKIGNACSGLGFVDQKCIKALNLAPITKKYEIYFYSESGLEGLGNICSSSFKLLTEIENESTLTPFISRAIVKYYSKGLKLNFDWNDIEDNEKLIEDFEIYLESKSRSIIKRAKLSSSTTDRLERKYADEINYATIILGSYSICLRAPEVVRNGEFKNWENEYLNKIDQLDEIEGNILKLEEHELTISPASKFTYLLWPYFIIAALSLKFGKGIAAVRKIHKK